MQWRLSSFLATRGFSHNIVRHKPVLIVGAGPVGLSLSIFLARHGVMSTVVEQFPTASPHPQAHFINTRTMEIFRCDMADFDSKVREKSPPQNHWRDFIYCTCVFGNKLGKIDHFGPDFDATVAHMDQLSSTRVLHLAQHLLTPLLLEEAQNLGVDVLFGLKLVDFSTTTDGVRAVLSQQNATLSSTSTPPSPSPSSSSSSSSSSLALLSADFMVGCDGASSVVRRGLDVALEGDPCLQSLMNVHFCCPDITPELLSSLPPTTGSGGRPAMLYFIYNPDVIGVLVAHDVERGEWVMQLPFFPPYQTPESFTPERCKDLICSAFFGSAAQAQQQQQQQQQQQHQSATEMQQLRSRVRSGMRVLSVAPWSMNAEVASAYSGSRDRDGRKHASAPDGAAGAAGAAAAAAAAAEHAVFLAGDSAHRFPPAGGFGMNTGIQDAHNLAWKLSYVAKGLAPSSLLASYDQERRPVALSNTALAVTNYHRSLSVPAALGMDAMLAKGLTQLVSSPPLSLLPESLRSAGVTAAVGAAQAQLSWLTDPAHPIGARKLEQVRELIDRREGLDLLFPAQDLGFQYGQNHQNQQALYLGCAVAPEPEGGEVPPVRTSAGSVSGTAASGTAASGAAVEYIPTTRPGARLPHVWFTVEGAVGGGGDSGGLDGRRVSSLELPTLLAPPASPPMFVLIISSAVVAQPWAQAALRLIGGRCETNATKDEDQFGQILRLVVVTPPASPSGENVRPSELPCLSAMAQEIGVPERSVVIVRADMDGGDEGEKGCNKEKKGGVDEKWRWELLREVGESGVVLVRPDGHVGWRAACVPPANSKGEEPVATAHAALKRALHIILHGNDS